MLDDVIYIIKLYAGLFLISYLAMKIRFWEECAGYRCLFKYFYKFLSILLVLLYVVVKLKALDVLSIFSVFILIVVFDYLISGRRNATKTDYVKIGLNQKIYDFFDGVVKFKFKNPNLKLTIWHFIFVFVLFSGLFLWVSSEIKNCSLSSITQHERLLKIASILTNNYTFGINDFGANSLCAFLSLIFGTNQYVVLHLFGAFNFLILVIGISLLTHELTKDFISVVLGISLFAFGFLMLNLNLNLFGNSSFLFALGWSLMLVYFWRDVGWVQRILSLISIFFIDIFAGFTMPFLIILSELLEKSLRNFKTNRKKSIKFILLSILIFFSPFVLEVYFSSNPELEIKVYALFLNHEVSAYLPAFLNVLIFLALLILIFELISWRSGDELFRIFYGIFSLLLLVYTLAAQKGLLNFVPFELFYPFAITNSFIWLINIFRKILRKWEFIYAVFVVCIIIILAANAFVYNAFKVKGSIEPCEIVRVIKKIQKESLPFSLALVSHSGTRPMVENWAWFMDWDYFIKNYILINEPKKIYDVVYVVVPKQGSIDKIHSSFLPRVENLSSVLDSICLNYKHAISQVYFDGFDIKVYKLTKLER
ncbi:MAG: hypothetical protein ACK44H_00905 [Candidatus Kryptonium sp.]